MLSRLVMACVAGAVAFLICLLVGALLVAIGIPLLATVGAFLTQWATAIAILVALAYFFGGGALPNPFSRA
jgi:hypothetical protein